MPQPDPPGDAGLAIELEMLRGRTADLEAELAGLKRANDDLLTGRGLVGQNATRPAQEEAQARLAAIVESSDDAIIGKTLDGVITSWNGGAERLFGYSAAEALGRHVAMLVPPERRDDLPQILGRIRRGERVEHYETVRQRKDGRQIVVSLTVSPIRDARGAVLGASKIARDITDRKHAEEELRTHAGLLEQAYDAAFAWKLRELVVFWNRGAEDLYGYTRAEAVGRVSHELLQSVFPEGFTVAELEKRLAHDGCWDGEILHTARNGRKIVVESRMRVTGAAGAPLVLEINRDVTENRKAAERIRRLNEELEERVQERTRELEAANKELEAFCYSVSHDLRAPLRSIDGFSRILLDDFKDQLPPDGQEHLQLVRDSTQQMGRLVDDLLSFSRLSRLALRKEMVHPVRVVRQCLDELRGEQEGRRVEIVVGEMPPCEADPALLKQVWLNLLTNALKYTRPRDPARIDVGARPGDGSGAPVYFVRDNGVGFDMRYAHKLFGVFQRLHRAEDYEGTGVGLAIVQRVVHRHGGRVWAEAEPDKGAAFHFTLGTEARHG